MVFERFSFISVIIGCNATKMLYLSRVAMLLYVYFDHQLRSQSTAAVQDNIAYFYFKF